DAHPRRECRVGDRLTPLGKTVDRADVILNGRRPAVNLLRHAPRVRGDDRLFLRQPTVLHPTVYRMCTEPLIEGFRLVVTTLHFPFDPAVGAGPQFVQHGTAQPVAAEFRADEQVVQPYSGRCLPRGETPGTQCESTDALRCFGDEYPGDRVSTEQVFAHSGAVEYELVVAFVPGVLLDQGADLLEIPFRGVPNRHDFSISTDRSDD